MYQVNIEYQSFTYLAKAQITLEGAVKATVFLSFGGEIVVDAPKGFHNDADLCKEIGTTKAVLEEWFEQHVKKTKPPYYRIKGKRESMTGWFDMPTGDTCSILVQTEQGTLKAEVAGDSSYPGIYLSYIDPNVPEEDIPEKTVCLLEVVDGKVALKVWEDEAKNESYDHEFIVTPVEREKDSEKEPSSELRTEIRISQEDYQKIQEWAEKEGQEYTASWTGVFPDGFAADFKCCPAQEESSWLEIVLFNKSGCEVICTEPFFELADGDTVQFECNGINYVVVLRVGDTSAPFCTEVKIEKEDLEDLPYREGFGTWQSRFPNGYIAKVCILAETEQEEGHLEVALLDEKGLQCKCLEPILTWTDEEEYTIQYDNNTYIAKVKFI